MLSKTNPKAVLGAKRLLNATAKEVFSVFEQPDRLAKWWGPNGFTNTFETFEFKPGGQWKFVMHGPPGNNGEPGTNYPNESVFKEIIPESRIVIEHVCQPWFPKAIKPTWTGPRSLRAPKSPRKSSPSSGTQTNRISTGWKLSWQKSKRKRQLPRNPSRNLLSFHSNLPGEGSGVRGIHPLKPFANSSSDDARF